MAELVHWLQNEQTIPSVLVAGIAQFQLVHIHPFLEENGRMARLLSRLCLYRSGYDFKKLFTIREYYDRKRQDYYNAIQSVRNHHMDMTAWLEYFTAVLQTQMQEIQFKGTRVTKLDVLSLEFDLSKRQKELLENFADKEDFSISDYELLFQNINRRSLQRDLAGLLEKGIIQQTGIKKSARYKITL